MANKMTIRDVDVAGKRVLVRVDLNVPLDDGTGEITNDNRIQAVLPTIQYLIDRGARVILASHLGRPEGRVEESMRLAVVARRLSQLLGKQVEVTRDCIGAEVEKSVAALKNGDVLLLENLRFYPGEEENDPAFAESLAKLADIYVDDAFGTAHRSHASIVGVAKLLPAVAGLLLEKELRNLGGLLESPAHPFAALLGGDRGLEASETSGCALAAVTHLWVGHADHTVCCGSLGNLRLTCVVLFQIIAQDLGQ